MSVLFMKSSKTSFVKAVENSIIIFGISNPTKMCVLEVQKSRRKVSRNVCAPIVTKKLGTVRKLKIHISKIHEQQDLQKVQTRRKCNLECKICSKNLKISRNLKHHIKVKHQSNIEPQPEEACTECKMQFSTRVMLNEHLIVVHKK